MKKDVFKLAMFGMVMTFGLVLAGCDTGNGNGGGNTPETPDEVVAQNITAAEVNACPTIGGAKDVNALIAAKLAGDANDTFTFPAGVQIAVSQSYLSNARLTIPAAIIKGVTDATSLTDIPASAWVDPANGVSLPFAVPAASEITVRNGIADSANKQATLFIVKTGAVPSRVKSDGSAVTFKLDKSIVAIFKGVTIADNNAAAAQLNTFNIILADNQTKNTEFEDPNAYPLMWVNNTNSDIGKIRTSFVGVSNFTTRLLLPDGRYLETDGIVTGTETD